VKEKIGETAGKIWQILQEKDEVSISQLPRIIDEKSAIINQALGWLAREDKIKYRTQANKTFVSLAEYERKK